MKPKEKETAASLLVIGAMLLSGVISALGASTWLTVERLIVEISPYSASEYGSILSGFFMVGLCLGTPFTIGGFAVGKASGRPKWDVHGLLLGVILGGGLIPVCCVLQIPITWWPL